jgi:hypothetical protein
MLDMAAIIAAHLAADPEVTATIYADLVAENTAYPYCLVRVMNVAQAVPPVNVWDTYEVQLDIVAAPSATAIDSVSVIRSKVLALTGVVGAAGIAGVVPASTARILDDSVSPARPRWVLTVEVTARTI